MNRYSKYYHESKNKKDTDGERQLKDPKTEIMVVKDGNVMVIDKKDEKKYMKMGYALAESKDEDENENENEYEDDVVESVEEDEDDIEESKKLDRIDKDELDGSYDDREDGDIDNDGDEDSSDEFLHRRRKAISKAIDKVAESAELKKQ